MHQALSTQWGQRGPQGNKQRLKPPIRPNLNFTFYIFHIYISDKLLHTFVFCKFFFYLTMDHNEDFNFIISFHGDPFTPSELTNQFALFLYFSWMFGETVFFFQKLMSYLISFLTYIYDFIVDSSTFHLMVASPLPSIFDGNWDPITSNYAS